MFSNISPPRASTDYYPPTDSSLPFAEYIRQCQRIITERRENLGSQNGEAEIIIQANSPFEYYPSSAGSIKRGVLLIHGLLDCPHTCRELGEHLQSAGILSRAILLPGHGTRPSDLLQVTYQEWQDAVRYGVESLKKEVDEVYLLGYSTGAALSICEAVKDASIAGIILLAPAIKIRAPVDLGASWHHFTNSFGKHRDWVYSLPEDDYVKYKSIAFNGVKQVTELSRLVRQIGATQPINTRMLMILSRDDETVSSQHVIDFFTAQHNPRNKMLIYTANGERYTDNRIETRNSAFPELNIANLSHPALPFSKTNQHYGQHGDYQNASHLHQPYIYGAYNRIEMHVFDLMANCRLIKLPRRVLTYNPDFPHMAEYITQFIKS